MSANIFFLYGATVIIWGTTWLAIKFQLGSVDPMVSVFYRFIAASVILMVYCRLADLKMRFHLKDHIFMALQGLVLFSVNYWIIYSATAHLTSGLVAVIFSSIVFMNMVNGTDSHKCGSWWRNRYCRYRHCLLAGDLVLQPFRQSGSRRGAGCGIDLYGIAGKYYIRPSSKI
jgi:hypothetical protein